MTPKQRARCVRASIKTHRARVYRLVSLLQGWENYRMCTALDHKRYTLKNAMQRWCVVTDRRKIKRLLRKGIDVGTSQS